MKKVIFVAGTSYSGSTMLDMTLANDPNGYSLGEFKAIIEPWRKHHFEFREKLLLDQSWQKIIKSPSHELYIRLFEQFPEIDFFIDSSKDPVWIYKNTSFLQKQGINYDVILIYKTPEELANSFYKRNILSNWKINYRSYHKKFFSLLKNYYKISYKELLADDEKLKDLCNYLGIEHFHGKKEFWRKEHKTFFGNNRTRTHVDGLMKSGQEKAREYESNQRKKLIHETNIPEKVKNQVILDKKRFSDIETIESFLENNGNLSDDLLINPSIIKIRSILKRSILSVKSKLQYKLNS